MNTGTDAADASQTIYERLVELIVSLQLAPGSMVTESALLARLGTSRSSLREAVVRLIDVGLATVIPRTGIAIAPVRLLDVQNVYEARQVIETTLVRLAAERGRPDQSPHSRPSRTASQSMRRRASSSHSTVGSMSRWGSWEATTFSARSLRTAMLTSSRVWALYFQLNGAGTDHYLSHRAIVRAIADRDPDAAQQAMERHLEDSRIRLVVRLLAPGRTVTVSTLNSVALDAELVNHGAELIAIRRDLHAHPELGFEEHRTAAIVDRFLTGLGLVTRTGVGGTGVVADLETGGPGPTILLRADMDGLPVAERTSTDYGSRNPGRMHACGHDGHVAMLLVTARLLVAHRMELTGRIRFLFQPAEELPPGGALAVIDDGVLEGVDIAVGLHLWNPLPVGSVGIRAGAIMAAHDRMDVVIHGQGGHGGMPQDARDPLLGLGHTVVALQSVVARGVSPLETAVVTVGVAGAGTAFNVIPDDARLSGSIRSLGAGTRSRVHERVREVVEGVAVSLGLHSELTITEFCPALDNDPGLAPLGAEVAAEVVGADHVVADFRTTASEDFAFIAQRVPSCFLFIGSARDDGAPVYPHHHPSFDIDERSLVIGVRVLVRMAGMLPRFHDQPSGGEGQP